VQGQLTYDVSDIPFVYAQPERNCGTDAAAFSEGSKIQIDSLDSAFSPVDMDSFLLPVVYSCMVDAGLMLSVSVAKSLICLPLLPPGTTLLETRQQFQHPAINNPTILVSRQHTFLLKQ
jgi:hypothetical protein